MTPWRFVVGFALLAIVLNAQDTPITGVLANPQAVASTKGFKMYAFVPRDGVFEREEAAGGLRWRMYTYSDKLALLHFVGENTVPEVIVVGDGVNRIAVVPKIKTTTSYYEGPRWGARQVGTLVSLEGTRERTDLAVDRSLLVIPADYTERVPSETDVLMAAAEGREFSDCEKAGFWRQDANYFAFQVKKAFVFERTLEVPGKPELRYEVYRFGTIVKTEFRGTETRTIIYDASNGLRRVLDNTTKSVQTYPWKREDTALWRSIVNVDEKSKSGKSLSEPDEDIAEKVPDGYTERSPSETYFSFMRVTGQKRDERYLAVVKAMDAKYKDGQDELSKRSSSCTASGTPKQ